MVRYENEYIKVKVGLAYKIPIQLLLLTCNYLSTDLKLMKIISVNKTVAATATKNVFETASNEVY